MDERFLRIRDGLTNRFPRIRWIELCQDSISIPKIRLAAGSHSDPNIPSSEKVINIHKTLAIPFGHGDYSYEVGQALAMILSTFIPMIDMSKDRNLIVGFSIDKLEKGLNALRFGWAYEVEPNEPA